MAWYQYQTHQPTDALPKRIRKSDGMTATDIKSLTASEIEALGITTVQDRPEFDDKTHEAWYDLDTDSWIVRYITDEDKISAKWEEIEKAKSVLLDKIVSKLLSSKSDGFSSIGKIGVLSDNFENVLNALDELTPSSGVNPFTLDYTDFSTWGISTSQCGITEDEECILYDALTEYFREYVNIGSYSTISATARELINSEFNKTFTITNE